ncbi:MAG: HAD family phosphatase [Pontiellaceae bacterium]|nr:HAD family phosphatase [Pontiellaceae bacterium]MBN2784204.1 HAD family phosphatase [Pontiellaceae bacterium]
MLSAVVFDFDGIIVDSEPLHFRAFNEVLKPLNKSITWDDYCTSYIGFDDRDAFQEIYKNSGEDSLSAQELTSLIEQKAGILQRFIENGEAIPLAGAVELIKSIPVRLPVALCSGALRSDIEPILEMLGISNAFSVIVTAEDTDKSKPDPAPYRLALEKLGIDNPASAVAIEDTPAGIISAKGAGLKVLAVTNSYDRDFLMDADAVVDSLEDVSRPSLEDIVM